MPAKFGVGDVLGTSATQFFKNIHLFVVFTAIGYLPLIVWAALIASRDTVDHRGFVVFEDAAFYLRLVCDAFGASAIAVRVDAALRGERASARTCFATGARRFLPSFVVLLVTTVAAALSAIVVVVPGIIVLAVFSVAVPVSVIERPGPFASLGRSRALTRGNRIRIIAIMFLVWIAMFGLFVIALTVYMAVTGAHGKAALHAHSSYVWCLVSVMGVFGTFSSVVGAVSYVRLRAIEEGGDVNLGKVFE